MAIFPVAGAYATNSTVSDKIDAFEGQLAATRQLPGGNTASTLSIDAQSVTPDRAMHLIDTQGQASTDTLSTIMRDNAQSGMLLWLCAANAERAVTLAHSEAVNGIRLAGGVDRSLPADAWVLLRLVGGWWEEVSTAEAQAAQAAIVAAESHGQIGDAVLVDNADANAIIVPGAYRVGTEESPAINVPFSAQLMLVTRSGIHVRQVVWRSTVSSAANAAQGATRFSGDGGATWQDWVRTDSAVAMARVNCNTGEMLASRGSILSVTKTGTGIFTISHAVPSPFAVAVPSATTAGSAPRSVTISSNGNNVRTYDASGTLADAGYFTVMYYNA